MGKKINYDTVPLECDRKMTSGQAGLFLACSERNSEAPTHHDDLLDGADDGVHERLELHIVIEVVGVADAHEEEVRRQPGDHVDHHTFGLQICEEHHREEGRVSRHMKNMLLPRLELM